METLQTTKCKIKGYIKGQKHFIVTLTTLDDEDILAAACETNWSHNEVEVTLRKGDPRNFPKENVPLTLSLQSSLHHILLKWYNRLLLGWLADDKTN